MRNLQHPLRPVNSTHVNTLHEPLASRVEPSRAGERLDAYLAATLPGVSRSQASELIRTGAVLLNGVRAKPSTKVQAGDIVSLAGPLPAPAQTRLEPEEIPLGVVYEDADVVVLDKAAGMVVHPSAGHETGTLVHALLARYPELRGEVTEPGSVAAQRPGIVHRLDKDTSGLMLVARNTRSLRYLQDAMRERRVLKEYTLLCCGALDPPSGRIDAPVGRHPTNRLRMAVVSNGRAALTEYETLESLGRYTLALARLHTGRTHQIRVHFSSVGYPLAGDSLYGKCTAPGLSRQFLHSSRLALELPSGRHAEWSSPLPSDLAECLATVRGTLSLA